MYAKYVTGQAGLGVYETCALLHRKVAASLLNGRVHSVHASNRSGEIAVNLVWLLLSPESPRYPGMPGLCFVIVGKG